MSPESAFGLANTVALGTWILLILFQRRRWAVDLVVIAVVSLLAVAYSVLIAARFAGSSGGFSTLADVATLFSDRWLLLAGWIHYLAFDLLVGRWEATDAASRGLRAWAVAPCMALTFLFGPLGWLSYALLRTAASKRTAAVVSPQTVG
jgi:hypothetical protein